MPKTGKSKNSEDLEKNPQQVKSIIKNIHRHSEEEQVAQFAEEAGFPYIDLNIFPIDQENIQFIDEESARKYGLVVLRKTANEVELGAIDPTQKETKEFLEELKKKTGAEFKIYIVSKTSIEDAWEVYKRTKLSGKLESMMVDIESSDLEDFEKELDDLISLEKRIEEIPTSEIINIIIAGAVKMEASDIHLEPQKKENVRLRYRLDGVLQTIAEFYSGAYPTVVSRIKMMSDMKINIKDTAQDGRFSIKLAEDQSIDIRVSILPGSFGENIVMRLLSHKMEDLDIEKVGVEGKAHEILVKESDKKQGIIINSGPTGSGKTTTLYSLINRVNTPDKKIITIENPVEYQIPGITQTQVEPGSGYDFASGLRAIVRQDPDIILVGEIRDEETAEIATQASLTGHLVLSTIHANSSTGVVTRLMDLGIGANLITSSVNAMVAQRLVRKLCPHCREKYVPASETTDTLKKMLSMISPKAKVEIPKTINYLWKAKGCPKCRGIGYKGRTGVFEILSMEDSIKSKILDRAPEGEILKQALEEGMITIVQDGILKALNGEISLEELQRVTGEGDYLLNLYEKVMVQVLSQGMDLEKYVFDKVKPKIKSEKELSALLSEASAKNVVRYTLAASLLMNASDIHIEPGSEEFKIRFRIDGVLQDIAKLPMDQFLSVLNEIKSMAGFSTESRDNAVQDGRFAVRIAGGEDADKNKEEKVDIRASIILGGYGDIAVLRVLSQSAEALNLESLSLNPVNLEKLKHEIEKPHGIILNTGPTGSGKTTTLYSIIDYLNKSEVKIITVEDPVEYQMEGIIQTQINEGEGYTFASAMRSLLRQNPDIMMIGEIRDEETAEIAYQAGLTGHLVLSTLHANSASASFQRLLNMRVNPSNVINGTNCFMGQRLIRALCPDCKKNRKASKEELEMIEKTMEGLGERLEIKWKPGDDVYEAVGCEKCHGIGYRGRIAVSEVLQMGKEMEKFLAKRPTVTEIEEEAVKNGMVTMLQDGILNVIQGKTTFEEVIREVGNE